MITGQQCAKKLNPTHISEKVTIWHTEKCTSQKLMWRHVCPIISIILSLMGALGTLPQTQRDMQRLHKCRLITLCITGCLSALGNRQRHKIIWKAISAHLLPHYNQVPKDELFIRGSGHYSKSGSRKMYLDKQLFQIRSHFWQDFDWATEWNQNVPVNMSLIKMLICIFKPCTVTKTYSKQKRVMKGRRMSCLLTKIIYMLWLGIKNSHYTKKEEVQAALCLTANKMLKC